MHGLDSDVVRTYFEQFSSSTVIRAFNFVRTSSFLVERVFWISVLIGFSCLTTWNVTETVKTFLSEPTASRIAYAYNVTTGMNFSDTIICMQMHSGNLLRLYEANIDRALAELMNVSDFIQNLKTKLDFVHEIEDKEAASLQNAVGNLSASDRDAQLRKYHNFRQSNFDLFTENEITLFAITAAMFVRIMSLEMDTNPLYKQWQSPAVQRVYEAYVSNGTNFDQLFDITAETMCVLLQMRLIAVHVGLFTDMNRYEPYNFCKHLSSPLYYGLESSRTERICHRLAKWPAFQLAFYSKLDYVVISAHPEKLYRNFVADLQAITLDPAGAFDTRMLLAFNRKQTLEFGLQTISTVVSLRRRRCWDRHAGVGSRPQCVYWCRAESVLRACNCRPLLRHIFAQFPEELPADLPACAALVETHQYSGGQCLAMRSSSYFALLNCSHAFYERECESMLFTTSVHFDDASLENVNASTVVKLKSINFVYQNVDEYVTMDAKAFVASLGGNLSLYLGASFLALIHIVVFFVKLPFEFARDHGGSQQGVATETKASRSTDVRHLESMLKTVVSDISRLRRHDQMVDRRLELIELDRKLRRGGAQAAESRLAHACSCARVDM